MRRNQILNSFQYVRDTICKFTYEQPFIFIIILILLTRSSISHILKLRLRKKYIEPYERSWNIENKDFYVNYYKKLQYVDLFWALFWIILIFIYLLTKDKLVWTILAVWIGWLIITFQTFTVSLFTYFLLIANYKVWDTIKVNINWDTMQWQILYMKLLHIWLSWKNDFWENTWESFIIPNYQMRNNPIIKVDLALDNYAKDSLTIIYDPKNFNNSFKDFSTNLKKILDDIFPLRSASDVDYFKSYIWVKYKIDYKYDWDWKANIRIWFIEKRSKSKHIKEKIISFVEAQKKTE
jgi:hypothetical protein